MLKDDKGFGVSKPGLIFNVLKETVCSNIDDQTMCLKDHLQHTVGNGKRKIQDCHFRGSDPRPLLTQSFISIIATYRKLKDERTTSRTLSGIEGK